MLVFVVIVIDDIVCGSCRGFFMMKIVELVDDTYLA